MGLPPTGDVIQIVDGVPNIVTQFGKCDGTKSIMQGMNEQSNHFYEIDSQNSGKP